jgi:hypothetical protein
MTRRNYAVRDVPKVLFKLILGWGEEYIEQNRVREFEDLFQSISDPNDRMIEGLCVQECVPFEHLEECITKTRNLLLGLE